MLIESLSLEEALSLFALPRKAGSLDGIDIMAAKGKFGPYIKYNGKNYSLPKGTDPLTVTEEACIKIIREAGSAKAVEPILDFPASGIKVLKGRYGPYIKHDNVNYRIPKGLDAATLSEEKCLEIIKAGKNK